MERWKRHFIPFYENFSEMINTKTKQKFCRKLKMIVKYNIGKTAIDLSNKMSAHINP